jgi:flagellar hook-associated protein 3 FlgL
MNSRIPDNANSSLLTSRINLQRSRLNVLQERLATGRRINRPSDDPSGAEMVLNLKTSVKQLEQFHRNAEAVGIKLSDADVALGGYETLLDRVKTLISRGLSEPSTTGAKEAIAVELESLRGSILSIANTKNGDEYLFGGTRQNVPPFDPLTAVPAATSASPRFVQIEPGSAPLATGIVAESVFSDATASIFTDLTNAVAALRGTGDPAADKATLENTMVRLNVYSGLANTAHATIGSNSNAAESAIDNLSSNLLSFDERITQIEGADFAETAVSLTESQRALDATLQVAAQGRRSMFDFLG